MALDYSTIAPYLDPDDPRNRIGASLPVPGVAPTQPTLVAPTVEKPRQSVVPPNIARDTTGTVPKPTPQLEFLHPTTLNKLPSPEPQAPELAPPNQLAPRLGIPSPSLDIAKPTKQESNEASKREYQLGLPPAPDAKLAGTPAYDQQELQREKYQDQHPYGADISEHPGLGGKFLHGLSKVGNILGDIVAPGVTSLIPGSDLNRRVAENQTQKHLGIDLANEGTQAETQLKGSQAENLDAETTHRDSNTGTFKPVGEPFSDGRGGYRQAVHNETTNESKFIPVENPTEQPAPSQGPAPVGGSATPAAPPATAAPAFGTKLGAGPQSSDKAPVPAEKVKSFPADVKTNFPLLSDGQVSSLASELGPNPSQGDLAKVEAAADRMQNNAQRAADNVSRQEEIKEQRAQRLQTANEARKQNVDNATNREIDKAQSSLKPILDKADAKIENLQEAVGLLDNPNGEKDAISPVKALVAAAGGQGTGVRITQAELSGIAGARGWTDSVGVKLNNIFDPGSYEKMSDTQRQQLKGIINDIYTKVQEKADAAHAAYEGITNSKSIDEVRQHQTEFDHIVRQGNENKSGPKLNKDGFPIIGK